MCTPTPVCISQLACALMCICVLFVFKEGRGVAFYHLCKRVSVCVCVYVCVLTSGYVRVCAFECVLCVFDLYIYI